jgi:hypothetical protein
MNLRRIRKAVFVPVLVSNSVGGSACLACCENDPGVFWRAATSECSQIIGRRRPSSRPHLTGWKAVKGSTLPEKVYFYDDRRVSLCS